MDSFRFFVFGCIFAFKICQGIVDLKCNYSGSGPQFADNMLLQSVYLSEKNEKRCCRFLNSTVILPCNWVGPESCSLYSVTYL